MMYSMSGCFPSSGAVMMNTLKDGISTGVVGSRDDSRSCLCLLFFVDNKDGAGVEKGIVMCADAAWMCCDDGVCVPEEALPRCELEVCAERGDPPLQDGHRAGNWRRREVVLYYHIRKRSTWHN